jgi:GT2 family glycosyltransferase
MDLSVIIVSYNVRYLLESCIETVIAAISEIRGEIIVVDNASTDGSAEMIKYKFSKVRLVENKTNSGFSKANNLGVSLALGENILILNPDTRVNKSAIEQSLRYLSNHAETGIVGVRMVDGTGRYLKESKRGFPDVWSSLFKITGIGSLFPNHKYINHYYMGDQRDNTINEVEVLTGAYMMMTKSTFESVGGFDEDYFMYGEDIDLSTRVRNTGKKLIYLGTEQIIHLKGRSSKSDSYNHVKRFYQAMSVFVDKNYNSIFSKWILHIGIGLAGLLSFVKRKAISNLVPLADVLILSMVIWFVKTSWGNYWFGNSGYFDNSVFLWNAGGYLTIWMISLWVFKSNHATSVNVIKSIWIGTVIILIVYSLLPEQFRSSRMVIVFSALILTILFPIYRRLVTEKEVGNRALFLDVENKDEKYNELFKSLCYTNLLAYICRIPDTRLLENDIKLHQINKIIFNPAQLKRDDFLAVYKAIPRGVEVWHIIPELNTNSFQIQNGNMNLALFQNQILKWTLNRIVCLFVLPFGWVNKNIRLNFLPLVTGTKYWVGYHKPMHNNLPFKKEGYWNYRDELNIRKSSDELNVEYAMTYSPGMDLKIILDHLIVNK